MQVCIFNNNMPKYLFEVIKIKGENSLIISSLKREKGWIKLFVIDFIADTLTLIKKR